MTSCFVASAYGCQCQSCCMGLAPKELHSGVDPCQGSSLSLWELVRNCSMRLRFGRGMVMCYYSLCILLRVILWLIASYLKTHNSKSKESRVQNPAYSIIVFSITINIQVQLACDWCTVAVLYKVGDSNTVHQQLRFRVVAKTRNNHMQIIKWPNHESLDDGSLILTGLVVLLINISILKSLHQVEEYTTREYTCVVYSLSWWRLLEAKTLKNNIILIPVNVKEPSSNNLRSGHFIIYVL